jgi:hypothetical protein
MSGRFAWARWGRCFGLFPNGAEAGRVRWVGRDSALITPSHRRAPTPPPPPPLAPRAAGRGAACSGLGRPGRAGCMHQIASSVMLRRLGLHRVGRSLDTIPPSRLGPGGRSSWAAIRPGRDQRALVPGPQDAHGGRVLVSRPVAVPLAAGEDSNGRKPSSAAARLGRCGPRDLPAADRRPEARLDRGLGVGSSTGSLLSR